MQNSFSRLAQVVAAATLFASSLPVEAQSTAVAIPGDFRGFFVGAELNPIGNHTNKYISDSTARTQLGMGVGVEAGFYLPGGLTPFVRIQEALVPRKMGKYEIRSFDYALRWRAFPFRKLFRGAIPYVEGGGTSRWIMQKNVRVEGRSYEVLADQTYSAPFPQITSNGIFSVFGAGIELPYRHLTQFHAGVSRASGSFDGIRFDGGSVDGWDFGATDVRLHVGLTRRFQ